MDHRKQKRFLEIFVYLQRNKPGVCLVTDANLKTQLLKHFLPVLTLAFTVLVSFNCGKKDCKPRAVGKDAQQMEDYANANNIDAIRHPDGFYYEITNPGSGASVLPTSNIVITYVGKFLNGQIFDKQETPNNTPSRPPWALSDLIEGWKKGIPLIKKGGSIKLIIPSALAYGCEQYYDIPGNSVLYFEIQLVDVQ
jgi:FKBP-type peptidyl-prolyl cis-trans isomerase FkpA